jgi:hypothetical protein
MIFHCRATWQKAERLGHYCGVLYIAKYRGQVYNVSFAFIQFVLSI